MITRVSSVIRPKGSDLIFDHPYNAEYALLVDNECWLRRTAQNSQFWRRLSAALFLVALHCLQPVFGSGTVATAGLLLRPRLLAVAAGDVGGRSRWSRCCPAFQEVPALRST
jgi:hypothetical protein